MCIIPPDDSWGYCGLNHNIDSNEGYVIINYSYKLLL